MFLSPNVRVDRFVDSLRILSYYVVFVERRVHTRRVFGMVCWLSLIYLRIEGLAEGGEGRWIFFSLVRASKTWANIVMAIQPGYRLLMSLDSTTSSFASDLTADPQWLFALYALCVTIRYIYIYIFLFFLLFKNDLSRKSIFSHNFPHDLRTHGTYYRYRTVKFIQRKINSARRLRVTRMLTIRWIELDERNGWKKYRGRDIR